MPAKTGLMENMTPNERQAGVNYFENRNKVLNYSNNSTFYTLLPPYIQNYAMHVIKPCLNWANGTVQGINERSFASYTGAHLIDVASSLITGEKIFFDGNNETENLLSSHWSDKVAFNEFHEEASSYSLSGGTAVVKLDIGEDYLPRPSAYRFDRVLFQADNFGEITSASFFINCITATEKMNIKCRSQPYWLIESRYYENGHKWAMYKVVQQSGMANVPYLPNPNGMGAPFYSLPQSVKRVVRNLNIRKLNEPVCIDYMGDGLNCWLLKNTSKNSTVPGLKLGDPFLLKVTDLLASFEFIFNATNTDIYIGKGKILVPKSMLGMIKDNLSVTLSGAQNVAGYGSDDFVYVQVDYKDLEAQKPHEIQFDLRAEDWEKLWGLYLKGICARVELDVPSVFPEYYTNSVKTATEINSEDKLTRRTTLKKRALFKPVMNRLIKEVARLYGKSSDISIRYSLSGLINEVEASKQALNEFTSDALSLYDYYKRTNVDMNENELWQLVERQVRWLRVKGEITGGMQLGGFNESDYFGGGGEM